MEYIFWFSIGKYGYNFPCKFADEGEHLLWGTNGVKKTKAMASLSVWVTDSCELLPSQMQEMCRYFCPT